VTKKFDFKTEYKKASFWWNFFGTTSAIYALFSVQGLEHYINFTTSSEWMMTSMILGMFLGFICSLKVYGREKQQSGAVFFALIYSFGFFGIIDFGLGPALTSLSPVVEKDITGVKRSFSTKGGRHYCIRSSDLIVDESAASIDISSDEYDNLPPTKINMHVFLKQSFFGTTVEQYRFTPPSKTN